MASVNITAEQAIEAARGSKGFVTTVAKRLDCSRPTVYKLLEKYSTFRQALEDERETVKDFAEGKLFQQIDSGNITAIIFYLKTQAKDRGYIEKQEVSVQVEQELTKALDALQKKLPAEVYDNILSILAGEAG